MLLLLLMMLMPFLMFYFINFIWLERSILMLSKCICLTVDRLAYPSIIQFITTKPNRLWCVSHSKPRNMETIPLFLLCLSRRLCSLFLHNISLFFQFLLLLLCLSFQFYGLCVSLAWNRIKEPKKMLHVDINTINLFGTSFIHTMPFLLLLLFLFNVGSENGPFKWCGINGWMDGVYRRAAENKRSNQVEKYISLGMGKPTDAETTRKSLVHSKYVLISFSDSQRKC